MPATSRPEHLVFAEHWLGDYAHIEQMPVLLFQKGTSLEQGSAVRYTGKHPFNRSWQLPLPVFLQAAGQFRDLRDLGDKFPQDGGFEEDANRQRLVDALKKPVWFVFDSLMVSKNGLRIEEAMAKLPESGGKGILSKITGIPVERAYILALQVPTNDRLRLSGLLYSTR